jgi:peptide/nickel transport system substrate-binding protein
MHRLHLAALIALLLAVAGCGSSTSSSGGAPKSTLTVAFNSAITTIDPAFVCTTYDYAVVKNTYDNLVQFDPSRKEGEHTAIVPALAEKWDLSADRKTYTFHLRDGVTFESGNPMTADDVVFSLQRVLDKAGCQQYVLTTGQEDAIKSISKVDARTVRIVLGKPDPLFLQLLAQTGNGVVDSKLLKQNGGLSKQGDAWLSTHTAGTGPYTLATYNPDSSIELAARKGYWGGAARNNRVNIRIVTDPTTLETLVNSGDVDMAYGIPLKDLASLKSQGKQVFADASQFFVYLGLNNGKKPFDDVRVRQALQAAMPVSDMNKRFGFGYTQPFAGPIPPAMAYYPNLPIPAPDVAKARSLLAEAGVGKLTLTLDVKSGETQQQEIATVLQAAYAPLGIHVKINTLGASAFSDKIFNLKSQMYLLKDGGTVNDPAYFLGFFVPCGNPFNTVQYCNKRVDELLASGRRETDDSKRAEIYREIAGIVDSEAPALPIFAPKLVVVTDSTLEGYAYYEDQQPVFRPISVS